MATALDLIQRAMRLAKILDAAETPGPSDSQDALATLNAILAELHAADIGVPDYSLSGLTDTLASDVADREALSYLLAQRVAPEYGVELTALIADQARQAESRLRLRYFQPGCMDLSELPGQRNTFNITTGDY